MTIKNETKNNIYLLFFSIIVSLVLAELVIRYFTYFPVNYNSNRIEDKELGYRLAPYLNEIDKFGFRNSDKQNNLLAIIGDSHTYGNNVNSEHSWPRLFERKTSIQTYNYGLPSYGVHAYHAILHNYAFIKSRGAIIALYPPNDFALNFSYCEQNHSSDFWLKEKSRLGLKLPQCKAKPTKDNARKSILDFAVDNIAIFNIVKFLLRENLPKDKTAIIEKKNFFFIEGASEYVRRYNVTAHTDYIHPQKIKYILHDFKKMILEWSTFSHKNDFPIGILIIPSKQRTLMEYSIKHHSPKLQFSSPLKKYLIAERKFEKEIFKFALNAGIPTMKVLPDLLAMKQKLSEKKLSLYKTGDGHPLKHGYLAYAETAIKLLQQMCLHKSHEKLCIE